MGCALPLHASTHLGSVSIKLRLGLGLVDDILRLRFYGRLTCIVCSSGVVTERLHEYVQATSVCVDGVWSDCSHRCSGTKCASMLPFPVAVKHAELDERAIE